MPDTPSTPKVDRQLSGKADRKIGYFLTQLVPLVRKHGAAAFRPTSTSYTWVTMTIREAHQVGGDAAVDSLTRRLREALDAENLDPDGVALGYWTDRVDEVRWSRADGVIRGTR